MGVPIASPASGVGAHLKALFAFSRGLQATLSLAQPALAAIIAAHGFPEVQVVLIGAVAAASGFLAVFALNDFLDVGLDRRRFAFLKSFTGFVSLQTFVNRSAGPRQLVTIFGFENEAALQDFLTQAQAADAPAEIRALVRRGKGAVFRSTLLFKAVGLSLP